MLSYPLHLIRERGFPKWFRLNISEYFAAKRNKGRRHAFVVSLKCRNFYKKKLSHKNNNTLSEIEFMEEIRTLNNLIIYRLRNIEIKNEKSAKSSNSKTDLGCA